MKWIETLVKAGIALFILRAILWLIAAAFLIWIISLLVA